MKILEDLNIVQKKSFRSVREMTAAMLRVLQGGSAPLKPNLTLTPTVGSLLTEH